MFYHNFKYSLKILLKNKMLIFWTILFPIILGTLFNMAFSDIEKKEKLDIIDIAIVNDEKFENKIIFKEVFKKLSSDSNKNKLFNIKYVSLDSAKNLLDDGKITGYLFFDD
ncbi:MAG: ABC transporter permease, partial [Bacilli bacterium]|nr:ABC transporter permease [Bacilli bacterium]